MPAYQSSKAALNSVTIALAKALAETPVEVTTVCPGFVQAELTPISRPRSPRGDPRPGTGGRASRGGSTSGCGRRTGCPG
ncbi:SDR family NAD(P)-dependent oxidoreductase [Nocardioides sp. NPDC058538]|uniref:SDR family NAD(P)-dependent oxidoreductase n=1 Tax=Nocardioides sp. NPDC058538 TaxID=3346542 RepID=UPI003662E9A0